MELVESYNVLIFAFIHFLSFSRKATQYNELHHKIRNLEKIKLHKNALHEKIDQRKDELEKTSNDIKKKAYIFLIVVLVLHLIIPNVIFSRYHASSYILQAFITAAIFFVLFQILFFLKGTEMFVGKVDDDSNDYFF